MAYTVLARKYRSRTFRDVIGQGPIATTLENAIRTGRIHHGYLFTGTRGVGKTSMARILAKALNCLKADAPTTAPCCECDACVAIAEGQDLDVVEIDAASNTGVDNIRELRSNTAYRPARCRYKIYIIDEVHMLSTGAFNALLKTLEEPPEHVKFILATTESQKVPATIQSRCQRFNFRNIGPDVIAERLTWICAQEGAQAEPAAIHRVARLANGSMRDALSILDQLLSISPEKLSAAVLDEVLPPAQDEQILGLIERAAEGDAAGVLTGAEGILSAGRGLDVFSHDLIETARTLMMIRACGADAALVDFPAAERARYESLAAKFELSHYVQMIAMLEELRRNIRLTGAGRPLTDAVLVRIANMKRWSSIEQLLEQLDGAAPVSAEKKKPSSPPEPVRPAPGQPERASREVRESVIAQASAEIRTPPPQHPPPPPVLASSGTVAEATEGAGEKNNEPARVVPEPGGRQPLRRAATLEEQARVRADPVVRRLVDLFEGTIVNIEHESHMHSEETE